MKPVWDFLWYLVYPLVDWGQHAWFVTFGILFPVVPLCFAWPRRRNLSRPMRWMVVYLAATWLEDLFTVYWSRHGRQSLWVVNLYTPFETVILCTMFAGWQLRLRWRAAIYAGMVACIAFWGIVTFTVEGFFGISRYTKPVESLLVVAIAAWTLVDRSRRTISPLTRHTWFWVSVGTMVYFAYLVMLDPATYVFSQAQPSNKYLTLWRLSYEINGALATVMYLFWLRAILLVPRGKCVETLP
jgi:hypothetical protein